MSRQSEREAFVGRIVAEATAPPTVAGKIEGAQRLLRLAATHARLAEEACNRELTRREVETDARTESRIRAEVARLGLPGVKFSGDPRGYTVKVMLPSGSGNSWGGPSEGWGVPTR